MSDETKPLDTGDHLAGMSSYLKTITKAQLLIDLHLAIQEGNKVQAKYVKSIEKLAALQATFKVRFPAAFAEWHAITYPNSVNKGEANNADRNSTVGETRVGEDNASRGVKSPPVVNESDSQDS